MTEAALHTAGTVRHHQQEVQISIAVQPAEAQEVSAEDTVAAAEVQEVQAAECHVAEADPEQDDNITD